MTEQDFDMHFNTLGNGYYYTLPIALIDKIKAFDNVEVNINFDLSKINDKEVLGFDYYALNGLKVKSLTISSPKQQEFKLLNGSLKDTGLNADSIHLTNITLVNDNSGVAL